VAAALRI